MESFEEKLIELVRDCEIIYNKQSSGYKNTNFKARRWLEISEKLSCTVEECMRRWKTLRDRYTKEVKKLDQPSGSGAISSPQWYLFDAMNFLRTHVAPRKTRTNFNSLSKNAADNDSAMESSTQEDMEFHEDVELTTAIDSDASVIAVEERPAMTSTPLPADSPSTSTSTGIGFVRQNRGVKRKKVEELDTEFFDAVKSFGTYVEKKTTVSSENKRFTHVIENLLETLNPQDQEEARSRMFSIITEYAYKKKP